MSLSRLQYLPIAFFSMVMGLAGLTLAWQQVVRLYQITLPLNGLLLSLTGGVFLLLLSFYSIKVIRFPQQVRQELQNPVKLNFFASIAISLVLLATALLPFSRTISEPLWLLGSGLQFGFILYVVNSWMHQSHYQIQHINPAWFIPAVGNVLVPITGVELGYTDLSWFFFSIGMLFWVILMTIVFYRILFHQPIDERLLPTLFILIAPPAVGFLAYTKLNAGLDNFGRFLFFSGLFLTLLLFSQLGRFLKLPFSLTWWAYSFPLAAISIANLTLFQLSQNSAYRYLGLLLVALLTLLVGLLLFKTGKALLNGKICQPE